MKPQCITTTLVAHDRSWNNVANERSFSVVEQHLQYFAQSHRAKVGGLQLSSTNSKFANLQTYLVQFVRLAVLLQCDTFQICDLRTQYFCDLQTSTSPQNHILFLTNMYVIVNSNLYIIKNCLKRRPLGLFWDRVVQYFVEICRLAFGD